MPWKRNLDILTGVQFVTMLSFTFVIPFLALFIRELDISDTGEVTGRLNRPQR